MHIQLAVDRKTIEEALAIARAAEAYVDVLEIGTSYIKDYGLASVRAVRDGFPGLTLLADIKTCDEAAYEFERVFEAGADIATVMGAAAYDSVAICVETARRMHRRAMIDLLECDEARIGRLLTFHDAIFCVHIAKDSGKTAGGGAVPAALRRPGLAVAAAGGIRLEDLPALAAQNVSLAVVGSAVTGAADVAAAAKAFYEAARACGEPDTGPV